MSLRIECPQGHKLISSGRYGGKRQKVFYCPYCKGDYPRAMMKKIKGGRASRGWAND